MAMFSITATALGSNGQNVFFAFDAYDIDTLEDLQNALAEDLSVLGKRYRVRKAGEHVVLVEGNETLLCHAGIVSVVRSPDLDSAKIEGGGR